MKKRFIPFLTVLAGASLMAFPSIGYAGSSHKVYKKIKSLEQCSDQLLHEYEYYMKNYRCDRGHHEDLHEALHELESTIDRFYSGYKNGYSWNMLCGRLEDVEDCINYTKKKLRKVHVSYAIKEIFYDIVGCVNYLSGYYGEKKVYVGKKYAPSCDYYDDYSYKYKKPYTYSVKISYGNRCGW